MDTSNGTIGGISLDAAVYIGIAIDVVLAIVAGVLIYWWRQRVNEKQKKERIARYMASQRSNTRTEGEPEEDEGEYETKPEDQRQINAVQPLQRGTTGSAQSTVHKDSINGDAERVEGNFAFLNNHMPQQGAANEYQAIDPDVQIVGSQRRSRVTFVDLEGEEEENESHYPANSEERVIHNPLSAALSTQTTTTEVDETLESENMAVSTYYTYRPPDNQLDGERSETLSEGERSPPVILIPPPPASPPPPIDPREVSLTDPGPGSPGTPPPPSDGLIEMINPVYETAGSVAHQQTANAWSTVTFGDEEVTKLYKIEMEESTDIL